MNAHRACTRWALLLGLSFAGSAFAGQAGIGLSHENATLSQYKTTIWSLTKTVSGFVNDTVNGGKAISWVVNANKIEVSNDKLSVVGFVTVTNSGDMDATLGSVILNLQRHRMVQKQIRWVSASVDIASAITGNDATQAKIVAKGSQEDKNWNAAWNNPATFEVSGQEGTFKKNGGSGTLTFVDTDNGEVKGFDPQPTIRAGEVVNVYFIATFDNSFLGIPVGEELRAELLVTFGNAGPRGDSGASAKDIDINGNGDIDPDEHWVRTVPVRLGFNVPSGVNANGTPKLLDTGLTKTGTVTYGTPDLGGYGDPGVAITDTTTFSAAVGHVHGGVSGGTVTNTVTLKGEDVTGWIMVWNGTSSIPVQVVLVKGTDLTASATQAIDPETITTIQDCTWARTDYATAGSLAQGLIATWFTGPPSTGIAIGADPPTGPYMIWNIASALCTFLGTTASPAAISSNHANETSSISAGGDLATELATLALNMELNASGNMRGPGGAVPTHSDFKDMVLSNCTGTEAFANGQTVSWVKHYADLALAGGALPILQTLEQIAGLLHDLNDSYAGGVQSTWAAAHLHH